MIKIGDRCTSAYSVSFYNNNGRRTKYRTAIPISGIFLGYTYKQFGGAVDDREWVGGFYEQRIRVAVIMPVHGTTYRKPEYVLPEDVEPVSPVASTQHIITRDYHGHQYVIPAGKEQEWQDLTAPTWTHDDRPAIPEWATEIPRGTHSVKFTHYVIEQEPANE